MSSSVQSSAARQVWLSTSRHLFVHTKVCDNTHMATNLALDDHLIEEARRVGRHKTKREAVSAALEEYVKRRKQLGILDIFGTVDFDPKYDYKAERRRKRS
jgi:Arc/MetJ family transcription regulator